MVKVREKKHIKVGKINIPRKNVLIYNLNCHDNPNKIYVHNSKYAYYYEDDNTEDLNFTVII